jgi:DNA-binding beta-propeller fold protein YncE
MAALLLATLLPACGRAARQADHLSASKAIPPPNDFSLVSPDDGATDVSLQPVFGWTAAQTAHTYRLQVATTNDFATPVLDVEGITALSYTPAGPLAAATTYWWRIYGINGSAMRLALGSPRSFTTASPIPSIIAASGSRLARYSRPGFASSWLTGPGLGDNLNLQALEFDPLTGVLLAIDANGGRLLRIDPTTGAFTSVGTTGFQLLGLALDPATRTLYASTLHRHLVRVDLATGLATDIGPTGGPQLTGLAYDPAAGILYGTEDPFSNLYTVNPTTGQATFLMNAPDSSGLAFDPNSGLLYCFASSTHQLVKINPVTMTSTYLGGGGFIDLRGLAFIPSSNRLLGVGFGNLYELNLVTGALSRVAQIGLSAPADIAYDPLLNVFYGVSGSLLCSITPTGVMTSIGPTGLTGFAFEFVSGVAFDPGTRTLYGTNASNLLTFDLTSGAAATIGPIGFGNTMDLAFDAGTSTLFGSVASGQLITINRTTGAGTLVGGFGAIVGIDGLAIDPGTGTLYATSGFTGSLYTVNKTTAALTMVGPLGSDGGPSLGFSTAEGFLYGSAPNLMRLNPATGLATPVNSLGIPMKGLAWDPDLRVLYGAGWPTPRLYRIDTATWTATYVTPIATSTIQNGFTFDRDQGTLWAIDTNRRLIRIDPGTGAVTDIGATGIIPSSIAYHPGLGQLYAVDLAGSDRLFELDRATGAATLVGPIGFTDLAGLTYDPSSNLLLAYDAGTDQFVEIDPLTGAGVARGRARGSPSALVIPY